MSSRSRSVRRLRRGWQAEDATRRLRTYGSKSATAVMSGNRYQRVRPTFAGSYRALGFSFDVRVSAPFAAELIPSVQTAFQGLAVQMPAVHRYVVSAAPGDSSLVRIQCDGKPVGGPVQPDGIYMALTTDINHRSVGSRPHRLMVHAGAVSAGGRAIILPGASGAGKSTLTAALLAVGFDYLTDEAVSIDLDTLQVEAYAKPLSLSPESNEALGVDVDDWAIRGVVPPSYLGRLGISAPAAASTIVFPRFEDGAKSSLKPVGRAEALIELANNSFNFVDHGGEWLESLARIVRSCTSWRLTTGDARDAARMLLRFGDEIGHLAAKK